MILYLHHTVVSLFQIKRFHRSRKWFLAVPGFQSFFFFETSESLIEAEFHQIKHPLVIQFVTFLGCLCDPFQWFLVTSN